MAIELHGMMLVSLALAGTTAMAETCHYQDWRWNVVQKRAVQQKTVVKDYATLTTDELDEQSGCSVCAEDQQTIKIDGIPEFAVCKRYAPAVRDALASLVQQGQKINSVIAYRVGRTRGEIDTQGNRTGFSNHSFGIALDINSDHNGLYGNCVQFGAHCQLMRGGSWRPGFDPFSLQQDGQIVSRFKAIGFKWGGEIQGLQKDFMHFSLTGY